MALDGSTLEVGASYRSRHTPPIPARSRWRERAWFVALWLIAAIAPCIGQRARASDNGVDELLARVDRRWQERNALGAIPDMVTLSTLALDIDPQSYEAQWRIARAYFWVAYSQPNRLMKKSLATKAMEWADRARQRAPERIEGHYFYAVALGQYATTVGLMTAVSDGVASKFEASAQRAYAIDRDYLGGAPAVVLGRYYFMLPWPLHDAKQSRRYLEEVVTRHPESLVARCYLAETYHDLGEDSLARTQLEYVLSHEPPPGTELELPEPKGLARQDMKDWFD